MRFSESFPRINIARQSSAEPAGAAVTLTEDAATYTLGNGIVTAQVAKNSGDLVSLRFKDLEMLATFYAADRRPDVFTNFPSAATSARAPA